MRLRKYGDGWTRRHFLEQIGKGVLAAGVIAPLWQLIEETGSCAAAYPPELLSIEAYTKGKIKPGDVLDASKVDVVKDLLDPALYWQIKSDGRVADMVASETDVSKLVLPQYLDATIRNRGVHVIGRDGNVYTKAGKPWIGGNPFPEPKIAEEVLLSHALAWGRHDSEGDAMRECDTDADGNVRYTYDLFFVSCQTVGRVVAEPKPYIPGHENELRIMTSVIAAPQDVRGMATLTIQPYDQHTFPAAWGFVPSTKRVRSMSPTERFNPLLPGSTMFMSDAWMLGDPLYTWGNFKLVSKGPMLGCASQGAYGDSPGWEMPLCGGKSGKKYFRTRIELVPEAYVVQLEPAHYSNCPYSHKRIWYDARTLNPLTMVGFNKAGRPLHQHEAGYGIYPARAPGQAPTWTYTYIHAMDLESGKLTRNQLLPEITGGYKIAFDDPSLFTSYCSLDALRRIGR